MQWQPINNATVLVASAEVLLASWHSHHTSWIILGGRRAQTNGGHSQTSVSDRLNTIRSSTQALMQ